MRRRAIGCAAAAATGAVLLVTASAQAQIPESVGDGIPTGQMGVQLFNYGNFLRDGQRMGDASPIVVERADCRETATQAERRTLDCAEYRTRLLFDFLRSKGVTNVELFGHLGFPASDDIPGLMAYRALLDEYGLHAGGWHGSMNESQWTTRVNAAKILGADYIGSGGVGGEGIDSYSDTLLTAQALNRMGKIAVEAGVGPTYIHNHTGEFDAMYVDDGVLKYAYDILMERTDPRYVVGELDVFWSSDAFNDVTGEASADFIEKHGSRIQLLHIKDGIDIAGGEPGDSRSGDPETTGTGELDFRPIFAAAEDRVRYYHQEHDGGTLTDADVSLTNLKGRGEQVVPTLLAKPQSFPAVPAGTAAENNVVPILVQNTGDAPLEIEDIEIDNNGSPDDSDDFDIVSENCSEDARGGIPISQGNPNTTPPIARGMCTVNVGFAPSTTNYTSVALLEFESNSDDATEQVLLVGTSTGDAIADVGGTVPSVMQLSIGNAASFGTFTPGQGRTYTTALGAAVTTTTGDATLSVVDPSGNAAGHLVNGSFSLAEPLGIRALGLGDPDDTGYSPVGNDPLVLKSWNTPVSASPLTVGLSQEIGGGEALRAGTYSKSLTFTLSTTTP